MTRSAAAKRDRPRVPKWCIEHYDRLRKAGSLRRNFEGCAWRQIGHDAWGESWARENSNDETVQIWSKGKVTLYLLDEGYIDIGKTGAPPP